MANGKDLELALRIKADLKQAQAALRQFETTLGGTGSAAKQASAGLTSTSQAAGKVRNEIGQLPAVLTRLAGLFAAAFSVREIAQAAQAYTTIRNRLALVTRSSEELAQAQDAVFQVAQAARQPLTSTAELYQRIATNADALGLSSAGVAGVVDTISKSLAISGTSGQAASAALTQLGQAFASGTLRGEELNSVLEQAPALAKTLADGLGVPIGKLRELGESGQLSAQNVIQALQTQAGAVDQQFGKIQVTGEQAMTALGNSLTRVIGELDQASGASSAFADVIQQVSQWLDSGQLTNGLLDSLSIWSSVFEAMSADVQGLGLDLQGVSAAGDETTKFLLQAFKEMPVNLRSAIQLATTEILALFDRVVIMARFMVEATASAFNSTTWDDAVRKTDERLAQLNATRDQSIAAIVDERDAILGAAAADRNRREQERKARDEARVQREKDIAELRKQAGGQGVPVAPGAGNKGGDQAAKDAEKYVAQLERQAATLGKNTNEVRAYELAEKGLTGALLERAKAALAVLDAEERKRQVDADGKQLASIQAQLLGAQGQQAQATALQLEQQYGELMQRLQARGDQAGQALISKLINVEQARAQLAELQAQIDRVFAEQARQEGSIQAQQQAGLLSEIGARQQIIDLHASTAAEVEKLLPQMQQLAAVTGDPAAIERVKDLQAQLEQTRYTADELTNAFNTGLQNGLQSALEGLAEGTLNLQEAATSFVQSIASSMASLAAQQLAQLATDSLSGLFGGGGDSGAGLVVGAAAVDASAVALTGAGATLLTGAAAIEAAALSLAAANATSAAGGSASSAGSLLSLLSAGGGAATGGGAAGASAYTGAFGFAEGGQVRGPGTPTSDSIPIWVSDTEFITRGAVVQQPGAKAFLDAFNAHGMAVLDDYAMRRWAHHNTGGLAGVPAPAFPAPGLGGSRLAEPAGAAGATVKNSVNLYAVQRPEDVAAMAWGAAGREHFMVYLQQNGAEVRQLLGVS